MEFELKFKNMQQTTIYKTIPRPNPALIEMLKGIPVADLHDEMNAIDRRTRLMSPKMRPLFPCNPFVGPAVTAYNTPGDNLMMHTALFYAQRGDVLVVTNGGFVDGALCGSNAAMQAIKIGVAAMVIDGPARDSAQIKELGFGVWSTSITASKPGKEAPGMVNTPIYCAGVRINPGDIVVGDQDSVIVIDPSDVERLVAAAKARIHRDEMMHVAISKGSTLFQEIGCGERLQSIGAVIKEGHWKVTD